MYYWPTFLSKSFANFQYQLLIEALGGIKQVNALEYSLEEIIDRIEWQTTWNKHWEEKKLYTCARVCGKSKDNFSKPKDQFIKRVSNIT